jgi:hypothetical protein
VNTEVAETLRVQGCVREGGGAGCQ